MSTGGERRTENCTSCSEANVQYEVAATGAVNSERMEERRC